MIKIETTTEKIESKGGLILAGKIALKAGLNAIKSAALNKAGSIIVSLFALMVEGKNDFESMGEKQNSQFFKKAMNLPFVYARETVRTYAEQLAEDAVNVIEQLRDSNIRITKKGPLHGLYIQRDHYLPVDIDTLTMDNSQKKGRGKPNIPKL